jgi:alpha-N-arabinofuranosidase
MNTGRSAKAQDPQAQPEIKRVNRYPRGSLFKRLFRINLQAEAVVNLDDVVGEIDPRIYGHFVESQEKSITDGAALIDALHPPLIRFSPGQYESEANQTALDAFLAFCRSVGAAPYLTVDVHALTPEDAARWAAHCNTEAPGKVELWGLGIGDSTEAQAAHLSADDYVQQAQLFITAMRAVDPDIQFVAEGRAMLPGDPQEAEGWNRTVLAGIGDQIDTLSFQIRQPDEAGRMETSDPEGWYHSVLSAPHSVEEGIQRMGRLIQEVIPDREIGIAVDAFNSLPPVGMLPTLQDGLYIAGMLNVFQRQCEVLKVANHAHGLNSPLIVKPEGQPAYPTPLYFPYLLYQKMESQLLSLAYWSPVFTVEALGGNISARNQVPYIDITATRSPDGKRVVLGITNRSPLRRVKVMVNLKSEEKRKFRVVAAQMMTGPDPLAANTADAPDAVAVQSIRPPRLRFAWLDGELPPASLMVVELEEKG